MPFTEDMVSKNVEQIKTDNEKLLAAAQLIEFKFMKDGRINGNIHTQRELGLYFIMQSIEKHNNFYGYSLVEYKNADSKVTICCPIHGEFLQTPYVHNKKGCGCPACAKVKKPTTNEWIANAKKIHGDKFDYTKVVYKDKRTPITIICPIHGEYAQAPEDHLRSTGCSACAGKRQLTTEEFISRSASVHSGKYDYTRSVYKSAHEKVEITCKIHGSFWQSANAHMRGQGCPECSGQHPDTLYLLHCKDTNWYKIGITSNILQRVSGISVGGNIEEVHCVKLADPRKHETILHKRYESAREYNLCVRSGNTEFFSLTEEQVKEVIDYMDEVVNER